MQELGRASFAAMGTTVTVLGPGHDPGFAAIIRLVRTIFERHEHRFSRFRPDSELSSVNASAGARMRVSDEFARLTRLALEAWEETDGRFDPTVLGAVLAAGYDRDFDALLAGARVALRPPTPCGRAGEIALEGRDLRLPAGVGLDFGGLAKGWTVDAAAEAAVQAGLLWVMVNAGGDLRVCGEPPTPVDVGIEDPERTDADVGRVLLSEGALATSSVTRRAWGPGLHHLIDPRTGRPVVGSVLQATVWAPRCAAAEVRAKDALILGEAGLDRSPAILVLRDGRIVTNFGEREVAA
jgi:thiamine biosynthesis lipoprotein